MNKKKIRLILIGMCIACYLGFITYEWSERNARDVAANVLEEELTIVTSFYPMYLHAEVLTRGTSIELINMASYDTGCLHDYTLTTEDMKKLDGADIFISNGGNEPFLEVAKEQNPNLHIIRASETYLETVQEYHHNHDHEHGEVCVHEYEEVCEHDHEHEEVCEHQHEEICEHDHEHEEVCVHEHEEICEHDHEHEEVCQHDHVNEHVWLSLEGAISQVQVITEALMKIDPANKMIYEENAAGYIEAISGLLEEPFEPSHDVGATVHNSFYYLLQEGGIEVVVDIPEGVYENASPLDVEMIIENMHSYEVDYIYIEKQHEALNLLELIQEETGSRVKVLDSLMVPNEAIDGVEEWPYVERMRINREIIEEK